jgi:hypothetical protein
LLRAASQVPVAAISQLGEDPGIYAVAVKAPSCLLPHLERGFWNADIAAPLKMRISLCFRRDKQIYRLLWLNESKDGGNSRRWRSFRKPH